MKTTSKNDEEWWIQFPNNVSSPLIPIKVANGSLVLQIETIAGQSGLGRSNSYYKAISASQYSWSFGLAELGSISLIWSKTGLSIYLLTSKLLNLIMRGVLDPFIIVGEGPQETQIYFEAFEDLSMSQQ